MTSWVRSMTTTTTTMATTVYYWVECVVSIKTQDKRWVVSVPWMFEYIQTSNMIHMWYWYCEEQRTTESGFVWWKLRCHTWNQNRWNQNNGCGSVSSSKKVGYMTTNCLIFISFTDLWTVIFVISHPGQNRWSLSLVYLSLTSAISSVFYWKSFTTA